MTSERERTRLDRLGELSAWAGLAFIGALGIVFVILCFRVSATSGDLALNLAILIASLILGWLAGMLMSPASALERGQFGIAAKAISTFASGYLLAKIDNLLNAFLSPKTLLEASSVQPAFRVAMTLAAFAGMFLHMYILRVYILRVEPEPENLEDRDSATPPPPGKI